MQRQHLKAGMESENKVKYWNSECVSSFDYLAVLSKDLSSASLAALKGVKDISSFSGGLGGSRSYGRSVS